MKLTFEGSLDEFRQFVSITTLIMDSVQVQDSRPEILEDRKGSNDSVHPEGPRACSLEDRKEEVQLFELKECGMFDFRALPTFQKGRTVYHILADRIHITRERYGGTCVYVDLKDLKHLDVLKQTNEKYYRQVLKSFGISTYPNKAAVLSGFFRDVEIFQIGCEAHRLKKKDSVQGLITAEGPQQDRKGSNDSVQVPGSAAEIQEDRKEDPDWMYRPMLKGAFSTRCDGDGSKIEAVT